MTWWARIVSAHNGVVFKTVGDGCCAVFLEAHQAVEAAADVQRQLGHRQMELRRAHTGSCRRSHGDRPGTPRRLFRAAAQSHGSARGCRPRRPDSTVRCDQRSHRGSPSGRLCPCRHGRAPVAGPAGAGTYLPTAARRYRIVLEASPYPWHPDKYHSDRTNSICRTGPGVEGGRPAPARYKRPPGHPHRPRR